MTAQTAKLLHVITAEADNKRHPMPAHALALMLEALDRAEADPRGLLEGICDNFNGRLAHKLLRAAGYEVTPEVMWRIK